MTVFANGGRSIFLLFMSILCLLTAAGRSTNGTVRCNESEKQALLAFKKGLVDPANRLASWTSGEEDCCRWSHVGCDNLTCHIIKLDLRPVDDNGDWWSVGIHGEISPSLLQLPYLSHLDLSENAFTSVSKIISSLGRLAYLDMSWNYISGPFPYHLGNLSMLEYLDLGYNKNMTADNFEWLDRLSSLRFLQLSSINFADAVNWLQVTKKHPSLSTLNLYDCNLPKFHSSSTSINSSNSLSVLRLNFNTFMSSKLFELFNLSTALVHLETSSNIGLEGPIPDSVGDMMLLEYLDLSYTLLKGGIPPSFWKLCYLKLIDLSSTGLSGPIDDIFQNTSCQKNSLEELYFPDNELTGSFPDISEFKSLRALDLSFNLLNGSFLEKLGNSSKLITLSVKSNQLTGPLPEFEKLLSLVELQVSNNSLNGSLPMSIAKLSNLIVLDVSSNFLHGVITEAHLSTLSKLYALNLSYNSFTFKISSDFVAPFQLGFISLRYCRLGSKFPGWLRSQKNYFLLDISSSQISDVVPHWFWHFPTNVLYMNLSLNHLYGTIPKMPLEFYGYPEFDLSSNAFYGPIPQFFSNSSFLSLYNNSFSGSLSFLCAPIDMPLIYLDLAHNSLSNLTDCWVHLPQLTTLILDGNNFFGKIPSSLGSLTMIETLHLRNNALTGELPASLTNCKSLKVFDLGENQLTGQLPAWIGESLKELIVLRLRSNKFHGMINATICHLSKIQLLDISFNNLAGVIPTCLNNFTAMSSNQGLHNIIPYYDHEYFEEYQQVNYAWVVWKGVEKEYRKTLGLLKLIDLSSNNLVGDIPSEITKLSALVSLNISRNNFSGLIPHEVGQMKELEVLDLSHNKISGEIPSSLADINRLSILDLSYNKLSGKIPRGTQLESFSPSAYLGNPGLCGCPLSIKCPGDNDECLNNKRKKEHTTGSSINKEDTKENEGMFDKSSFYGGIGLGFAVGFIGFCSFLVMNKSWRCTYFRFLNKMWDSLYILLVIKLARRGFNAARSQ